MASARRYAVATHWIVVTETWKSLASVASATATIVVSRMDMIEPRTTTVEVRRSSGERVKAGALERGIGILHNTQRYEVVKEFPRCDNRWHGPRRGHIRPTAPHHVRGRVRRADGRARHPHQALARRDQDADAPDQGGRRVHGRDGPRHRRRPLLRHGPRRRPRCARPGPARAGALRPPGEDHRADRRRPEAGAGDRRGVVGAARRLCGPVTGRAAPATRPARQGAGGAGDRALRHRRRSPPPLLRATTPSSLLRPVPGASITERRSRAR